MRHAILVIGYGNNANILQQTINILDDKDIDFYIHWDKRYSVPALSAKYSKIFFIKKRIKVKWGSSSLIKVTIELLKKVYKKDYSYVHLISSNDIPLMTKDYFKSFFTQEAYIGYVNLNNSEQVKINKRIEYWYPGNVDFRKHDAIFKLFTLLNKFLHINRLENISDININKGTEWFSIKTQYINQIITSPYLKKFMHGYCADELLIPTLLPLFKNSQLKISTNDCIQAARYIDWNRGQPYVFKVTDIEELKKIINTKFSFARKVNDPSIPIKLFN